MRTNIIYNKNCLTGVKKLPNESIDLIITSPPYFVKKEYEKTYTYEKYKDLINNLFKLAQDKLKKGAYFVVNFGDYFNSGNRFYESDVPSVYPATINYFNWGIDNNFDLQATRIWRKKFSKMGIPFVCNHHPRGVFDYEHIWTFRKKNNNNKEFVNNRKLSQRSVLGENWNSSAGLNNHCASFPIELPLYAIDVYLKRSKENIVLDPFMGSGTTAIACLRRNVNYIGYELSKEYFNYSINRINKDKRDYKNSLFSVK